MEWATSLWELMKNVCFIVFLTLSMFSLNRLVKINIISYQIRNINCPSSVKQPISIFKYLSGPHCVLSASCNWLLITDHIVEAGPRLIPPSPLQTLDRQRAEATPGCHFMTASLLHGALYLGRIQKTRTSKLVRTSIAATFIFITYSFK